MVRNHRRLEIRNGTATYVDVLARRDRLGPDARLLGSAGIYTPVCPTNETLLCYFERGLALDVERQVAAHLDDCEGCRTVLIILVRDRKFCLEVRGSRVRS